MEFGTKEELFKYVKDNLKKIIAEKKSAMKYADAIDFVNVKVLKDDFATKAESETPESPEEGSILVKVVINTTNLIDSHMDCHIPGLWKKSLQENKTSVHLREHNRTLDYVIADGEDCVPSVKMMNWTDLGYAYEGKTQALIFQSKVTEDRNEFMYKQYLKGWVKQHSVGMRYVDMFTCINSEDKYYTEEKANWDKYYPQVANKEVADDRGLFWAVTTAKMIEGSAVVFGSNSTTPTLSVKTSEPITTQEEPVITQTDNKDSRESTIDFTQIKFI